jgi:uncharacterized protein involved in type VI secretion and phage assembly
MSYDLSTSRRIAGVVVGVVTDNKHPEGDYAVKLKFPWIASSDCGDDSDFPSSWCPVATIGAGGGRGMYCLPEVDDEVVVAFFHGDMRFPIVLGSLWNAECKMPVAGDGPPEQTDPLGNPAGLADCLVDNNAAGGENNARFWVSREGSGIVMDDTAGKTKLVMFTSAGSCISINDEKNVLSLYDSTQQVYLALDADNKKIVMECVDGDIDIFCKNGTFTLEAKDIVTKASADQTHEAGGKWVAESGGKMNIKAGGDYTCEAPKIKLNP